MRRKNILRGFLFLLALALCASTGAQDTDAVIIERGEAKLTIADLDGRMSRLAAEERAAYAHRPENLGRLMDQLLLNRQLAAEAKELDLDKKPDVMRDLELAVEEVLAIHRLNALTENAGEPDLEQLAMERYRANPVEFMAPEERVVEHILVKTDDRSDEDALQLAERIRAEAMASDADFVQLVEKYSEDPGKGQNQGRYVVAQSGQFVPEFEAAARSLSEPGEITSPIKTRFGYHLIRLVEIRPERQIAFAEVRAKLIELAREEYLKNKRASHTRELRSLKESANETLLLALPQRYGGRMDSD